MFLEFLRKGKSQNSLTGIENDTIFKVFHIMGLGPAESLLNRGRVERTSK